MKTLADRIWETHEVVPPERDGFPSVLYADLHLIHEVTSPQAFAELEQRGLAVRRPDQTFATLDHSIPTGRLAVIDREADDQLRSLEQSCRRFGIRLFDPSTGKQGIVHVIGPELGLTQPGMTIVCGDSHTSTHGAFGALAFGIGTSQVAHALATQSILMKRPRSMLVRFDGRFSPGVTAKDAILALIRKIGIGGGTGCVFEYCGEAIRSLDMEGRMTICNMSIEAGARAGLIAPDDTTIDYLRGRELSPRGHAWERALAQWYALKSDEGAFEHAVSIDVSELQPMITFGTTPEMAIGVTEPVPAPRHEQMQAALDYMQIEAGRPLLGKRIDVVFIGSCTNARISDLRSAAAIFAGRRVKVRVLVVPGSQAVKRQAEAEGLDRIFLEAGAEWRDPGCSMCIAMNGDQLEPGQCAVSTSNRNFEGRQGPGGRTILASPATAAAAAVTGKITDPRTLTRGDRWNRSLA